MKKLNIVEAVMARLTGTDEAKLKLFVNKSIRTLENNIRVFDANIINAEKDYEDDVIDAQLALEEAVLDIDMSKIDNNEARAEYLPIYARKVKDCKKKVAELKTAMQKVISDNNGYIEDCKTILELWDNIKIDDIKK